MTKTQKNILAVLSFIAAILLGLIGYYALTSYLAFVSKPLGPALPVAPQTLPPIWTATPGTPSSGMVTLAPTISFPTNTPEALCGGPNVMTVLAIGQDQRSNNYQYGLGDIIRVVRIDFVTPKVTVLEFPRDLWVEIPYIADNLNGLDHGKLNQAYLYGQPGDGFAYWDDPSRGPGLLSLTLNLNFGVQADHYLAVNMRTFENVVNAIDGITINVPDLETSYNTGLPIGRHHLDGAEALKVARNRKQGMYERVKNQNLVLCAMREKVLSPSVVTQIPALIDSFKDNIQTDFSPDQLSQLACLGARLPTQNIAFASFPQELLKEDIRIFDDPAFPKGLLVTQADFNILREYVTRFNTGTWPSLPAAIPTNTTTGGKLILVLPMKNFSAIPPLDAATVLKRFHIRADKSLGQNFLQDSSALERIVLAADIQEDDCVLEIGPGLGSLTRYLALSAKEVTAIELDADMLAPLRAVLTPYQNVRVIHGDILKTAVSEIIDKPDYLVVANIPYYITSAVIRHLLESEIKPRRIVLTIQKEVAERICAQAGDLSLLALSVQVYGKPGITSIIPADSFHPAPKVDSAILRIDIYDEPLIARESLKAFFQLTKAGFSQKRKTLRNSLSAGLHIPTTESEAMLTSAGIDFMRRAETLSIEEWESLIARMNDEG